MTQSSNISSSTQDYLQKVARYFVDSNSSEMSYRAPFQQWLEKIFPQEIGYLVQHDQRAIKGNKPDFVVIKNQTPLLYIEVKKVGENLDKITKSSQAGRYFGYTNLIITDYLEFRFFRNGQQYDEVLHLAKSTLSTRTVTPHPDQAERVVRTIQDFVASQKEPIKSGKHLAKIMGGKAKRIRDNVVAFLQEENDKNTTLFKLKQIIQEHLVAKLDVPEFADMYAQTLVYGLFAARYQDNSLDSFTRQEARDLVPASNPFLRHFFDHIAGVNFPNRLDIIVSELCEVFTHADVKSLVSSYYSKSDQVGDEKDPIIHFYEDFLSEYDAAKKMEMGVFYTPQPVVQFIVRSVDELLKEKFGIARGLADSSKTSITIEEVNAKGKVTKKEKEYHRVQILDIATGTGTFLNEVVKNIHAQFAGQEGRWPAYAANELLPRLHGFELMMASYTIAHIKLGLTLKQTGVNEFPGRLGIYLTNTLEEPVGYADQRSLFDIVDSIAEESRQASRIKTEVPVMVVIGNPPYSGESMNPSYHGHDVYKVEPGGTQKLQEKNSKWLNDDYVKFIRLAESLIEKNGHGIVGMITAHGYIDNPTFRGMRWHLKKTFNEIYVLDLHGNSNKKETSPDGTKDENVFDIKTGVSILLCVKKDGMKNASQLAKVHTIDLYGLRKEKFRTLENITINSPSWHTLPQKTDVWKKVGEGEDDYKKGFSVAELFPTASVGVVTARDHLSIQNKKDEIENVIQNFINLNPEELRTKYQLGKDARDWKVALAKQDVIKNYDQSRFVRINYRPFDTRWTFYTDKSKGFICMPRGEVMKHFLAGENVGLLTTKYFTGNNSLHVFLTKHISEAIFLSGLTGSNAINLPLYLYHPDGTKQPNLDPQLWAQLTEQAGKPTKPEDVLDYVYAYLHSPTYRETYKEFLKTDFPRVPWPSSREQFWQLVPLGTKLRQLHLLEAQALPQVETTYPIAGENTVTLVKYDVESQQVWINDTQYFGNVPKVSWEFFIGGYQPAQKWLKDRKGDRLTDADLTHYQNVVAVLAETDKLMREVDTML